MTRLIVSLFVFILASSVFAEGNTNELFKSYQREIMFLSTYKKELESKIKSVDGNLHSKKQKASRELSRLERQWLGLQTQNELLAQKLSDLERDVDFKKENKDSLEAVLQQAEVSLPKEESKDDLSLAGKVALIFDKSMEQLQSRKKLKVEDGEFFSASGEQIKGQVVSIGSVARFGIEKGRVSALYPTGGGAFRVWSWLDSNSASLMSGEFPKTLSFFLYEDAEKEFVMEEPKSWLQTIQSGGAVAWIIVLLGALAFALSLLRYGLLRKSRLGNAKEMEQLLSNIKNNDFESLKDYCLRNSNSVTRVIGKTLTQLKTSPDKVEDVIAEGIVQESQLIDRFGVFILVIASVAPLLGLLGTVSGMISTFDIITLHGTGNPKLLSGGISEALVTTMLGLIVAIPTLFVGHFLGSINESIKSDMERWALTLCNRFQGGGVS